MLCTPRAHWLLHLHQQAVTWPTCCQAGRSIAPLCCCQPVQSQRSIPTAMVPHASPQHHPCPMHCCAGAVAPPSGKLNCHANWWQALNPRQLVDWPSPLNQCYRSGPTLQALVSCQQPPAGGTWVSSLLCGTKSGSTDVNHAAAAGTIHTSLQLLPTTKRRLWRRRAHPNTTLESTESEA